MHVYTYTFISSHDLTCFEEFFKYSVINKKITKIKLLFQRFTMPNNEHFTLVK